MKKFSIYLLILIAIIVFISMNEVRDSNTTHLDTINVYQLDYELPKEIDTIVFLMEFNDYSLSTTIEDWHPRFFGEQSSLKSYYQQNSFGLIDIIPVGEGVYKVKVDLNHPNYNSTSELENIQLYFKSAILELDEVIDFSDFDDNQDGNVSSYELAIFTIMAGYEDPSSEEAFTTSGVFSEDPSVEVDDVMLNSTVLVGEITLENGEEIMTTIGVFCHEFGHSLGLPDLYDIDYSSQGLGFHALMSGGTDNRAVGEYFGQSPAPLSAWSKEFLGIIEPTPINESGVYRINRRSLKRNNMLRIENGQTYYLLEYVTFDGYGIGLDEYIESEGLAIWEVNPASLTEEKFYYNEVNADDNNYGVRLIEAENKDSLLDSDFDYYRTDYEHYFSLDGINEIELDNGMHIEVINQTNDEITIKITQ